MIDFFEKGFAKTIDAIKALDDALLVQVQEFINKETLEEILIESDVNYELIETILEDLPGEIGRELLAPRLMACFTQIPEQKENIAKPFVQLIIGVNGAGKTTTIAKLAAFWKRQNHSVLLGAGDTFRAAAIEQLTLWAERLNIPIVSTKKGHDPSAVTYDAISSARSKNLDNVIIDTAGRLHTKTNLANELKKIVRVSDKAMIGAPHQKILVIDGTQGSSAVNQAKQFNEMVHIDGIIITKLDGTAKGGAIFTIADELKLPILFVGVGEQPEDLIQFDAHEFVEGLLDKLYTGHTKF
jgi:fused signal recognition particle receptor